ncbi:MAG: aminotransferase class III-fold pyridoxal phosphate-dependent enzyme [Oscillospiraceae bacterium]|nr:aminotransferase class III-fold pyridoxal phosphate-dependent enzyme [Oscillospiraceae bacterium]
MTTQERDNAYVAGTYKRFPLTVVSGQGSLVRDENGREYIDLGSGIAVNSFGVADPVWQQAVTAQLGKVQHMSNLYYTEPCALLAEQLCLRTGMKKVFFSNSGAEANECAIKVARKWAAEHKSPEHYTIVTLKNSFHGRTLTTLAATGQDHFHELFQPLTSGFVHAEAGNAAELKAIAAQYKLAAVMVECVQGEGGVLPLTPEYAKAVQELVREQDILLLVDEVQTGNGRTGRLYAYMNYGLEPDVVSTAKGLAGGLPLGATMLGERVQDVLGYGDHGSTFGGNPVSCAGALSILNRVDDALLAQVREKGDYLKKTFTGAPGITSVSGLGLMLGLQTKKPAGDVLRGCMDRGVLCLTAKDRLRLLPALNIPMELLQKAAAVILDCCE